MALGREPKHVALMIFYLSLKNVFHAIKSVLDSQVTRTWQRGTFTNRAAKTRFSHNRFIRVKHNSRSGVEITTIGSLVDI